jgi:hypothetical protein
VAESVSHVDLIPYVCLEAVSGKFPKKTKSVPGNASGKPSPQVDARRAKCGRDIFKDELIDDRKQHGHTTHITSEGFRNDLKDGWDEVLANPVRLRAYSAKATIDNAKPAERPPPSRSIQPMPSTKTTHKVGSGPFRRPICDFTGVCDVDASGTVVKQVLTQHSVTPFPVSTDLLRHVLGKRVVRLSDAYCC